MKNRRKTADGYQRWMMKAAKLSGAAAFGVGDSDQIGGIGASGGRAKKNDDDGDGNDSDRGAEDEDDEEARKNRLGMNNPGGDEEGEEPAVDLDLDDDEGEKGKLRQFRSSFPSRLACASMQ
jgi:transcription initiation factor TFIIF subunit alpha